MAWTLLVAACTSAWWAVAVVGLWLLPFALACTVPVVAVLLVLLLEEANL